MSATVLIAVTISPQARSYVDRIDQLVELDEMIDRARQSVPGLRSIDVVLDEATEEMSAGVILLVLRDDARHGVDSTHRDWIDWMLTAFPPEVCQNVTLLSVYH